MKAIILSAGKGTRIAEATKNIPKPMIRVKGKPILEHNILWLKEYGITDLYINLHYLPDVIMDYFGDGSDFGVRIAYSYEPELLGTAGGVRKIAKECWHLSGIGGDLRHENSPVKGETFLVVYGDNLFEYDLREIIAFHRKKQGVGTVALYEKNEVSQSGMAVLDAENKIIAFIEKPGPKERASRLVNIGLYVLEPGIFDLFPPLKEPDFGKHIFPSLIQSGANLFGIIVQGNLTAIDTTELLERTMIMENK